MRIRLLFSLFAMLSLMTAPADAAVLYSCEQSTAYQPPLASTRHADVKSLSAPERDAYFVQWLGYLCTGDYMRDLTTQADGARRMLDDQINQAGPGQKLALVLDIDETALSNEPSILGGDLRWPPLGENQPCDDLKTGCGYTAWERKGASAAIRPTLELFREAEARGVSVFFITGRFEEAAPVLGETRTMRQATAANLDAVGYHDYVCLFLKPQAGSPEQTDPRTPGCAPFAHGLAEHYDSTALYKLAVRQAIAAQGYTIILNVGDQTSDLGVVPGVDDHTAKAQVLLPDPFY